MQDIRIGAAQFENRNGDKQYNLSVIRQLTERAVDGGAELGRNKLDALTDDVKSWGGKGLVWMKVEADGTLSSPVAKFCSEAELAEAWLEHLRCLESFFHSDTRKLREALRELPGVIKTLSDQIADGNIRINHVVVIVETFSSFLLTFHNFYEFSEVDAPTLVFINFTTTREFK